jgi:hypothetical protein
MLHQLINLVIRIAAGKPYRRTRSTVISALGTHADMRGFVPASWLPNHRFTPIPDHLPVSGDHPLSRPVNAPEAKSEPPDTDGPDAKVVRLVPRRRTESGSKPDLPDTDNDDDGPGPAA